MKILQNTIIWLDFNNQSYNKEDMIPIGIFCPKILLHKYDIEVVSKNIQERDMHPNSKIHQNINIHQHKLLLYK